MKNLVISFTTLCLLLVLGGCSIYRIDVQQGTVVTPEAVEKLKLGMNRNTVKSILGAPPISDPFRRDRWDYIFSIKLGNEKKQQNSHVTLLFTEDKLQDIIIVKPPIKLKELMVPKLQRH